MKTKTYSLASAGLIAALYTALTVALGPLSYLAVQVRISEALTLLPIYSPAAVWGVTLGCLLSNLIGVLMGTNILGVFDVLFGTAATLAAALCSRALRNVRIRWHAQEGADRSLPLASAIPPVILNAAVVGLELCYVMSGGFQWKIFLIQAAWVGLGELISCLGLGMILCWALERTGLDQKLFNH
ncbi:MAG: QueT transporter family protein [Provencibacterium sp.]|jgi:uncharacterized membrane protein|nr:QueT transporter family protein [Provencibacterium sp.]